MCGGGDGERSGVALLVERRMEEEREELAGESSTSQGHNFNLTQARHAAPLIGRGPAGRFKTRQGFEKSSKPHLADRPPQRFPARINSQHGNAANLSCLLARTAVCARLCLLRRRLLLLHPLQTHLLDAPYAAAPPWTAALA
jgi:hypothetical protein